MKTHGRMTAPKFARRSAQGSAKGSALTRQWRRFRRDEDGAMIIFSLMMFCLMVVMAGLSFDLMRYEAHRERLQATLDRAVLSAASLGQTLDRKDVVVDYFNKAGLGNYIHRDDIYVDEGFNYRRVEATARIYVPLHHGGFAVFGNGEGETSTVVAQATSVAEESIGNVEISMVLDVSGSMNRYNRIGNLKTAAKGFIDTVYGAAEPNAVTTSIIPYATQVNAGDLLDYFRRDDSHEHSHCVNWSNSDFEETSIYDYLVDPLNPNGDPLQQTAQLDPWTNENYDYGYDLGEVPPNPVCPPVVGRPGNYPSEGDRAILPWSTSTIALHNYIDGMIATGNTSTDVGTKWGAALLDPSTQPIVTDMIAGLDLHSDLAGRPYNYDSGDSMKILVVMTDGAHTNQYFMDDYHSGPSFVWRRINGDDTHYYIWHDGANSTPDPDIGTTTYCKKWKWGVCKKWATQYYWYEAYNTNTDGNGYDQYRWTEGPHADAERMDWADVWADIPPEYFSDKVLKKMGTLTNSERDAYEQAMNFYSKSKKDGRFDDICEAAKGENVIVFTIGLEVDSSNAQRLQDCATSPALYYDVDNLDLEYAFQSIASHINQLRLTQ